MHFEILVEDESGKQMLNILVSKIIGSEHSFRIKSYKGIGQIPKGITKPKDASKRILLDNLPKALCGYGKTYANCNDADKAAVIVVCDLDNNSLKEFHNQLLQLLEQCQPKPNTAFCFAIEEGEAWLLGDFDAIKKAYPKAKENILSKYVNDSICGTWEHLADAIYSGGSQALKQKGWVVVGAEKSKWAVSISTHMNIDNNKSKSFNYFKQKLEELIVS